MTTPKKAKYNLRNRTVLVDASGNAQSHTPEIPRLNLDMSFGTTMTSDDEIMAETAPPEWISETLNALTDEIQQLQVNWPGVVVSARFMSQHSKTLLSA